jgi:hypothetical protein
MTSRALPPQRDPTYRYPGIHEDLYGGMTDVGHIIKDAWVLGVIAESETCEGWTVGQLKALYDRVYDAWEPYQHMASLLPADMKETYLRIYTEATRRAKELGWIPPMESD